MQQSIYHIENDIDCRVLKFGKDICTAIAGEDSIINLCKGRHKLSFISTENECDVYSMILEVPENGIEDFIEVELSPIRNARLERETRDLEAEHERLAAFERRRLEEERARQEQLAREELERKLRLDAEIAAEKQRQLEKLQIEQNLKIQEKVVAAMKLYNDLSNIDGYKYNKLTWIKDQNELYYLSRDNQRLTDSIFKVVSKFSCGFASVSRNGYDYYFINEEGKQVFDYCFRSHSHFYNGKAIIYILGTPPSYNEACCILINAQGVVLKQYPIKKDERSRIRALDNMAHYKGIMVFYEEHEKGGVITALNVFTQEEIYSIQLNYDKVV